MDLKALKKLAKCAVCSKKTNSSDQQRVHLHVGCMRRGKRKDETVMLSDDEGKQLALLFDVTYDPGDPERAEARPRRRMSSVDVELPWFRNGQGEVYFCSTDCLRTWFNRLVDHVERNAEIGRSNRDPVYRMTKFVR